MWCVSWHPEDMGDMRYHGLLRTVAMAAATGWCAYNKAPLLLYDHWCTRRSEGGRSDVATHDARHDEDENFGARPIISILSASEIILFDISQDEVYIYATALNGARNINEPYCITTVYSMPYSTVPTLTHLQYYNIN